MYKFRINKELSQNRKIISSRDGFLLFIQFYGIIAICYSIMLKSYA